MVQKNTFFCCLYIEIFRKSSIIKIKSRKNDETMEFDVPSNSVFPGGKAEWGDYCRAASLNDRANRMEGFYRLLEKCQKLKI